MSSISSMTGFARQAGAIDGLAWQWEVKSVNNKALDIRLRLPPGCEGLELPLRNAVQAKFKRGSVQISLLLQDDSAKETVSINQALLDELMTLAENLRQRTGAAAIQPERILALRGVIESSTPTRSEEQQAARDRLLLKAFDEALDSLALSRQEEGRRLQALLEQQLLRIADLARQARDNPSRKPEAVRQRLAELVSKLLEQSSAFDEQRLHQEAVLLATRSDIQEELDRLESHLEAARALLQSGEPVGRKFDFLAQELNREANTLCSKSVDKSLTAIGLDLKTAIDQLREQVQNIE